METRDRILEFVKGKGPVLPVQVSKDIGSDILMASAHLAELTASKRLRISSLKVGGSPLYYLQGQENMLENYTSSLNDKEKKAFDFLKENKVLKDAEQQPVIRVALRAIKDFAMPLNVNYNGKSELFWKWYAASDEEAEKLIKSKLEIAEEGTSQKLVETQETLNQGPKREIEAVKSPEPEKQKKPRQKKKQKENDDRFIEDVRRFFEKNNINVLSSEMIRKTETDFIIEIPSAMGNLQYYCKAKSKKSISDSDLSNVYVNGQFKKLPVIFISNGELSAKAQEIISKLVNLTFKKI